MFIASPRGAVGIGAPGAADRPAVGHAAAADQAYAIVAFARDGAAVLNRRARRASFDHSSCRVEIIGGGDARAGTRDGAAVDDGRWRAKDRHPGIGRERTSVV